MTGVRLKLHPQYSKGSHYHQQYKGMWNGVKTNSHLCDDKQRQVQPVHEQISDAVLDILLGTLHITVYEQLLQAGGDDILDQQAIVTPHCLNALAVHFVMRVCVGPQQSSIPLLVDQQVREVHLSGNASLLDDDELHPVGNVIETWPVDCDLICMSLYHCLKHHVRNMA